MSPKRQHRRRIGAEAITARRVFPAALMGALTLLLALLGLGDAAFGGDAGAIAAIVVRPAAARLLAEARRAPVVSAGPGFALAARTEAAEPPRFHAVGRGMSARLPRDAGGRIELGVAGEARRVGVRRAFATAAAGRLAAGALVYPDAAPGIDAVWFARGDDAEELLVVRAGAAAIAYDLELPAGSTLVAPAAFPGLVEVRDARGSAWLRMTADAAWDAGGRPIAIRVRVEGARVWIDVPADAARPVIVDPTWFGAGHMAFGRTGHTATLLGSGEVLIAGGRADDDVKGATAELFDPTTGRFTAITSPMKAARSQHSATLLHDGKVLLVGGLDRAGETATAEVFDPATASFGSTRFEDDASPRADHTATLLTSGNVLLVGGDPLASGATSAEVYDAENGFIRLAQETVLPRRRHTATPLGDGRVLFAGGDGDASATSIEIFDPATARFVLAPTQLSTARAGHTTTRLPSGRLLIAGGDARKASGSGPATIDRSTADLVDPQGGSMTTVHLHKRRVSHTATLLNTGDVLLVGGAGSAARTSELVGSRRLTNETDALLHPRPGGHTATLLPSGDVLIAGGYDDKASELVSPEVEIYTPHGSAYSSTKTTMAATRLHHTATRLRSGEVLVFGGVKRPELGPAAELYDPSTDSFSSAGADDSLNRTGHTATLLPTGEVLVLGGEDFVMDDPTLSPAVIYDPRSGFRSPHVEMKTARRNHAATALPSGEVLITGGVDEDGNTTQLCEIYDPRQNRFRSTTKRMVVRRAYHTATLLLSGEVLIVGGTSNAEGDTTKADDLGSAEIYNPLTEEFRVIGGLVGAHPPRGESTATLLPSGEVLILGAGAAEIYDPIAGTFRVNLGSTSGAHEFYGHSATLLPSGRVLIAGGSQGHTSTPLLSPLVFAPSNGELIEAPDEQAALRSFASATLLASGEVLVAGGQKELLVTLPTARRWREAPSAVAPPQIISVQASTRAGTTTTVTGTWGALGLDSGGGNSGSASSNQPIAVWMPETGGAIVGGVAAWTTTTAAWTAPYSNLVEHGLLFMRVGAASSPGIGVRVLPGPACNSNLDCGAGLACSAEGRCVDPVNSGAPEGGCGIAPARAPGSSGAAALLLGIVVVVVVRRGGRGTPTARRRAARCSRRRRGRRAPARRTA